MKCPVCPIPRVPDGTTVCPGCGTNLSPLRRIQGLGAALYCEAVTLAQGLATDEALIKAAGAVALDGRDVNARKLLGKLLWKKGRVHEAAQQWEKAAALAPDDEPLRDLVQAATRRLRLRALITQMVFAVAVLAVAALIGLLVRGAFAAILGMVARSHGEGLL